MVGVSKNWKRPSNFAMKYLQKNGYKIIPLNPKEAGNYILGQLCYANLEEIPVGFSHLLLLKNGKNIASGTMNETMTSENISKCFDLN